MKNILLPTDFSDNSWNAIKYALGLFKDNTCNFYLLHVNRLTNLVTADASYTPTKDLIEEVYTKPSKTQLREMLKRISEEVGRNDNHSFYTLVDYNFFIESIRRHVEDKKIDTIVMGTKGASGLKEFIVGSNTGDVITKVQCTTLVVPENAVYSRFKEVAFPTDFTLSYSINTLRPISDILKNSDATIRILHIVKNNEEFNGEQKENKELLEDYFADYKHGFHFLTNKKVEDAVQCFVESRDIDLIVMVAKSLNYFQQILFHSRVEKISYHTKIPFLVLHE
ncbi:MAG: universal stress protein [Flavobacteriaceae bacterium]|nr:MAG: universal stress protein [Flavobacteriaceae bacterium]